MQQGTTKPVQTQTSTLEPKQLNMLAHEVKRLANFEYQQLLHKLIYILQSYIKTMK